MSKALSIKQQASGHITMIVSGGRRGTVVLADFDNRILNGGLDRIHSPAGALGHCQVGASNAAVSDSQTSLSDRKASTSSAVSSGTAYVAGPPDYIEYTITYRFAQGALDSLSMGNFAEVGLGWLATGGLFCRALISVGGTPTAIQVLADEQLDVVYKIRTYPPQTDSTGTVVLDGSNYSYTLRAAAVSSTGGWLSLGSHFYASGGVFPAFPSTGSSTTWSGAIGSRTNLPSGSFSNTDCSLATRQAYVAGDYVRKVRLTVGPTGGNWGGGGLPSVCLNYGNASQTLSGFGFQIGFSPTIPKDATKRLELDFDVAITRRP